VTFLEINSGFAPLSDGTIQPSFACLDIFLDTLSSDQPHAQTSLCPCITLFCTLPIVGDHGIYAFIYW
jgi:hypothetical protein